MINSAKLPIFNLVSDIERKVMQLRLAKPNNVSDN